MIFLKKNLHSLTNTCRKMYEKIPLLGFFKLNLFVVCRIFFSITAIATIIIVIIFTVEPSTVWCNTFLCNSIAIFYYFAIFLLVFIDLIHGMCRLSSIFMTSVFQWFQVTNKDLIILDFDTYAYKQIWKNAYREGKFLFVLTIKCPFSNKL